MHFLYLILLAVGTAFRFIALDQSLWLDEAITANAIRNYSFSQIFNIFSPSDFHPPLYYFLLKAWSLLFGHSEIALRFPSIIFSLISAIFIFKITRLKFNYHTAFWASLFFYFNPLIIYYSQEARPYSLVVLLFVASIYFLIRRNLILLNISIFLSLSVFYGSIFYVVPIFIYVFFKKDFTFLFGLLLSLALFGLSFGRLLLHQLQNSSQLLELVPNWSSVLGRFDLKNLLLIPVKMSVGRISFYPKIIYWTIAFAWTAYIFTNISIASFKNRFWLFFLVTPFLIASVFAVITGGGLQYFRLIFLIPVVSILLAVSQSSAKIFAPLTLLVFTGFSLAYLAFPQFHRENWKFVLSDIPYNTQVFMIKSFADPVAYYRPDLIVQDISLLPVFSNSMFYVLPYGEAIHGINHLDYLSSLKHIRTIQANQLSLEVWSH